MTDKYHQGKFKPNNPQKYKGNIDNIVYRSGWELQVMCWLDRRNDVIQWSSEEIIIPYKNPIDGRIRRYFPDFKVKVKNKEGNIETWIVEVKPKAQTKEPQKRSRITKKYVNEVKTYATNVYKWSAAEAYCKKYGYRFLILTEDDLNIKY